MSINALYDELAADLIQATRNRSTIPPLRDRIDDFSLDDAYSIQTKQLDHYLAGGARLAGRKIGLTSVAMQQQLGVDSPDFGFFLDDMVYSDGDNIAVSRFIAPRVEPELGFVLRHGLAGPGVTLTDVEEAVEFVFGAIEIIDSRIEDWNIRLLDTVADNASCGAIVLGREPLSLSIADLRHTRATLSLNGENRESGLGSDVLGDPLHPLVWLANVLGERGVALEAGQTILTGSFTKAVPITAGDRVIVAYEGLGAISVSFS